MQGIKPSLASREVPLKKILIALIACVAAASIASSASAASKKKAGKKAKGKSEVAKVEKKADGGPLMALGCMLSLGNAKGCR